MVIRVAAKLYLGEFPEYKHGMVIGDGSEMLDKLRNTKHREKLFAGYRIVPTQALESLMGLSPERQAIIESILEWRARRNG